MNISLLLLPSLMLSKNLIKPVLSLPALIRTTQKWHVMAWQAEENHLWPNNKQLLCVWVILESISTPYCNIWKAKIFPMPTCKNGMMPSRAMACSSRGAPVRLWSPAPQQEKNEPITITQGDGQARIPMTGFFFTEKPNLKHTGMHTVYQVCYSTLLWWLMCCATKKPIF